jgi:SAM-dependent methyltransferase
MKIGDFTEQADAYARSRPDYPRALVERWAAALGVGRGDRVADIGAGTGIFTRLLATCGFDVVAVEPNAEMRAKAPDIPMVDGTFEATSLEGASIRWALAAQAFHWADPPLALVEMRRILAPGGPFTVFWNDRDFANDSVVGWTREVIRRTVPEFDEAYRNRDWAAVLSSDGSFVDVRYDEEPHAVRMSRARYLDLWRGHNRLNNIAGPERFAVFIGELETYLSAEHIDEVNVPYVCRSWTGVAATTGRAR